MSYSIKYVQGVITIEKVGVDVCAWSDPILGIIGIADTASCWGNSDCQCYN